MRWRSSAAAWTRSPSGYPLTAFLSVALSQASGPAAIAALREVPEVVEMHATTGDADLLMKVVARDTADLHRITTSLFSVPGVVRTSTSISLATELPPRHEALLRRAAGLPPGTTAAPSR